MPLLARRIGRAKPSAIMAVAEKAKKLKAEGRDIISFSIGVPNFLPGDHVYKAARDALAKDTGQYGSNRGTDALLDAFLQHIEALGLTGYTRANLSTGIGAKHILYNLAEALLDEGDTIAYAVPYWTTYADIAEVLNAKILELPCPASQDYKLTPAQLDAALATKPKVFLFNNPNNPTGMVYTREEIAALADVVAKHPDTWVITDDIYNTMVFDGLGYHNFVQARPELRERVIFVDSLSKTYGMPGWRVGFIAGPESVAKAVATLNSNHITNIPEVTTAALAEWVNQWLAGLERLRWAHIEKPITSHQTTGGAAKGGPVPFARLDRDSALRDWRAQWQSLLAQGRLPAGSAPPAAGQALVPMEALLMGRGQLALAQQWGRALDQVSAGMDALTPRASERELLALTKSMKAVTVLFQNDVAAALDVPLGFSDADGD